MLGGNLPLKLKKKIIIISGYMLELHRFFTFYYMNLIYTQKIDYFSKKNVVKKVAYMVKYIYNHTTANKTGCLNVCCCT